MLTPNEYMQRALFCATMGRGRTSPNPLVGAVIVSPGGVVVGQGYHRRAGGPHAEVNAIEMAAGRAGGATLYCTLEPCCHTGRTGPCVERIVEAGIVRVVAAVEDPDPRVSGRGFAYLRACGVAVEVGLAAEAARRLNQPFFTLVGSNRPLVVLKAAMSADGCIAAARGVRTPLTSDAANRHAHGVRAEVDAIGVGVGTVLVDDPLLTPRGPYRERPLIRAVFDRRLRTPPSARLLATRDAGPIVIITTEVGAADAERRRALVDRGALVEVVRDQTVRAALERLGALQVSSLLIEGGAGLHGAVWDEGLADIVRLYVTPHTLGPQGLRFLEGRHFSPEALFERRVEPLGPDLLVEGYVHRVG
jgi:diaminohydroxyphosphoribosylaminopyrimidine deaminase/5-amino-6-(5-phosphoribosylamino)uracil reductase